MKNAAHMQLLNAVDHPHEVLLGYLRTRPNESGVFGNITVLEVRHYEVRRQMHQIRVDDLRHSAIARKLLHDANL